MTKKIEFLLIIFILLLQNLQAMSLKHEKDNNRGIIISPSDGKHTNTLIFMHGLGDSAEGFFPVFFDMKQSPLTKTTRVRLLTAPATPVTMNMGMTMNSWFDILDMEWSENSVNKQDVIKNSKWITSIMDEEIKLLGGDSKKLFIGGFSQGGCMALNSGLKYKEPIGGIIGLSCFKFPFSMPGHANDATPVMLAHGTDDGMIPIMASKFSYGLDGFIEKANVAFHPIQGLSHSIDPQELMLFKAFFEKNKGN